MRDEKAEEAASGSSKKQQKPEGFLSFSRVADLNDMNVDLSKQLMEKRKPLLPPRSPASTVPLDPRGGKGQLYAIPPTSAEVKSWARSSGYRARNAGAAQALEGDNAKEAREAAAKEAADAFEASKKEMQLWTSATALVCTALTYSFYTRVCHLHCLLQLKINSPDCNRKESKRSIDRKETRGNPPYKHNVLKAYKHPQPLDKHHSPLTKAIPSAVPDMLRSHNMC